MGDKFESSGLYDIEQQEVWNHEISTPKEIASTLSKWEIIKGITDFLVGKWWKVSWQNFFKWELKSNKDHREIIKPTKMLSVSEIKNKINSQFNWIEVLEPLPILSKKVDTFFVVSGIQKISPVLFDELPYDDRWHIVHQPSIRLKFLDQISWTKWNWISFINTNLYKVWCSFEEYLEKIDEVISMLWSIWIYAWNVTLELFEDKDIWNNKDLKSIWINFKFGNLEMGEAMYVYDFKQNSRENIKFCDIWLWLERIMYARNNIQNYFQQYGLNLDNYSEKEVEIIKALVLMLTDDIQWASKTNWAWLRYKHLLKHLDKNKNYFPLIKSFYLYRSQFTKFPINTENLTFDLLSDMEKYI